jgi:sigma-B regulation protein RsbU (phosphoserine phosphatase)
MVDPAKPASTPTTDSAIRQGLKQALHGQRKQVYQMSQAIQRYLPPDYPEMGGLKIVGHCRPCADLGGDFYDAFPLPDGRVALCMADVAGHGAIAAVLMASSRALLRASLHETAPHEGPAIALQRLSRWLQGEFLATEFVTMWLGFFDPATEELVCASGAHPRPILWRSGEPDPHFIPMAASFPIGLAGVDPVAPPEHTIPFSVGDRLFLYTDGWTESPSEDGRFLEELDLLEFFANSHFQPTDQVPTLLFTQLERHAANSFIRDDVSLLVVDRLS